jgi:hypothetical protein
MTTGIAQESVLKGYMLRRDLVLDVGSSSFSVVYAARRSQSNHFLTHIVSDVDYSKAIAEKRGFILRE